MEILKNLAKVQRPGRYIGREYNSTVKNWDEVDLKFLISYPDLYEIGMSNFGLAILYEMLNKDEDILCERCFAPWSDMENLLKKHNQPLYSLENKKPISKFDCIGFTLQHELNYTNILNILDLGNLKIWQKDRGENHPLIIGGGPSTLNPETVADFFDFFVIGDAEEVIWDILKGVKRWKHSEISRDDLLSSVSDIEGVYVPSLYKVKETKEGFLVPEIERRIKKVSISNLSKKFYPVKPIVPYIKTVHDRVNLEIMRGCPNSCHFCQASIYYGPVRYRGIDELIELAVSGYKNTGYEQVCLSSLSSGNYPYLLELLDKLNDIFKNKNVFMNLPSLWIGKEMVNILKNFVFTKRPNLTFAPEVSSMRMKNIIGKHIKEEDLVKVINYALDRGWKKVKLYYMLGLPGLSEKDLKEMKEFLCSLLKLKTKRKVKLNLNFSTFIPKPHTPLQWMNFISKTNFEKQFNFIRNNLSKPNIKWSVRKYEFSLLEAVLARGDRKLSKVIYEAWGNGARFDSWSQKFDFNLWEDSFAKQNINYVDYLSVNWEENSILPWEHIDAGVSKDLSWDVYNNIKKEI